MTRRPSWPLAGFTVLALAAAVLLYTGTGRLITARVPGNAIGWLLALIGLLLAGVMLTEQYALYGLVTAPGSPPAVKFTGWFSVILAVLAAFAVLFLLLLFPDGRLALPSSRWRPVRLAIGVVLVVVLATATG